MALRHAPAVWLFCVAGGCASVVPTPRQYEFMESGRQLTNITIYRLTPINYTGVANMDTADAPGDAMFGLNQMLLPQLCPADPTFTWCANRQYLSGGSAHMVYTAFTVEADHRFGQYQPCNPNPATGRFECQPWSSNVGLPPQCAAGFDLEHEDCLNGTVLRTFEAGPELGPAEAACCAACVGPRCAGWNLMPPVAANGSWSCSVLTGQPVEWSGAQASVGCKAAYADPTAYACWYTDPAYNTSFASECDRSSCTCDAVANLSVGREQHAMCWDRMNQRQAVAEQRHSRWFDYVGKLACLLDGTWYSTLGQGQCDGPLATQPKCWWRLAETHRTVNASCVDDAVVGAVRSRRPECWSGCPQPSNRSSACFLDCLFETILGNHTSGVQPMSKEDVVEPFVKAFSLEQAGGCPAALCAVDEDCRVHGDQQGYCKANGWCRCSSESGFAGQFCERISS